MGLRYNADNSNGIEIFKFKADKENVNFPPQFRLRSIYNGFNASEPRKVSLNGNVYDFSILLINLTY